MYPELSRQVGILGFSLLVPSISPKLSQSEPFPGIFQLEILQFIPPILQGGRLINLIGSNSKTLSEYDLVMGQVTVTSNGSSQPQQF